MRFRTSALGAGLVCLSFGAQAASKINDTTFTVTVEDPQGRATKPVVTTVTLLPKGGYKVNLEYPIKLVVEGPADARPSKLTMTSKQAASFTKAEARFKPSVTISRAGKHAFKGLLSFSVCTDKQCELKRAQLSWVATVK